MSNVVRALVAEGCPGPHDAHLDSTYYHAVNIIQFTEGWTDDVVWAHAITDYIHGAWVREYSNVRWHAELQ